MIDYDNTNYYCGGEETLDDLMESTNALDELIDAGQTFFFKSGKKRADQYEIGMRVMCDIPNHSMYLSTGTITEQKENRFLVQMRTGTMMYMTPDDMVIL